MKLTWIPTIIIVVATLTGCEAKIQQGLDERQANELLTALLERGFQPEKVLEAGKKPSWSIVVDASAADNATRVLVELGLPRERQPTLAEVIKPGMIPTATEEAQVRVVGLQGDLSRTLEAVEGVIAARVHLVVPPPARAGQPAGEAKASAFLRVKSGVASTLDRQALRELVAGSVENLRADSVTLMLDEAIPTVSQSALPSIADRSLRSAVGLLGAALMLVSGLLVALTLTGRLRIRRRAPAALEAPERTDARVPAVSRRKAA